jgi:hypothetical protein
MKKRFLTIMTAFALVVGLVSYCFATDIRIAATIGEVHQMDVVLNKVVGSVWTIVSDLTGVGMDFGSLTKGPDNVYRADSYFVIDAPVTSNHATWDITHTRSNFQLDASNNLNSNTNVTFVKVDNASSAETTLTGGYVSYQASNSKVYTSADLAGGRLRIYYGIANGSGDATGVTVITTDKPHGTYTGLVTLTLSS